MIIELPYPHKDLMPNRKNGKHWASTIAIKDKAISEAYFLTLASKIKIKSTGLIPLTITFVQADNRKRDLDNLLASFKPYGDGLAKALNINDAHFEPITIKRGYGEKAKMLIEITDI